MEWDGKLGGGGTAASGAYSLRLTADGALGVTTVAQPLTVDLTAPRLTASATASVRYGKTAKLTYTVRDAYSPVVKVSATVTDAKGRTVATLALGWVKRGVSHICAWKPRVRRTYTVTFKAVDLGGNHQAAAAVTYAARPLILPGSTRRPQTGARHLGGTRPCLVRMRRLNTSTPRTGWRRGPGSSRRVATCAPARRRGARAVSARATCAR